MKKTFFVFSLIVISFAVSLHSSDHDLQCLQQKTLLCLDKGSLAEAQSLIHEIQVMQDDIHQRYQLFDTQLQSIGFNYAQCQVFVQRFMALNSEELVQDEAAPYNNPFLFTPEKKILFRGLKAKRIAQQQKQDHEIVEQQVKLALDAYVQQNLIAVGSEQQRLVQANQNILLHKFLLGNKSITLNSWKDSLELHKNRLTSFHTPISTAVVHDNNLQNNLLFSEQQVMKKNETLQIAAGVVAAENINQIQTKDTISNQEASVVVSIEKNTKKLLASDEKDAKKSIAVKKTAKDTEQEKKQKAKEAELKKIQDRLQQQEAKRQADEAEKIRRELQRQKDLERQAQQKAAVALINSKNNEVDDSKEKQKEQALAKKQAKIAAEQKALQAKLKAEARENRLLEEAQKQAAQEQAVRGEDALFKAHSIKNEQSITRIDVKAGAGLSEKHAKAFYAYCNFINFPSIDTLDNLLLDKIITAMPTMLITIQKISDDVAKDEKDLADELLKTDPNYFNNIAQIRLNWVSALLSFADQYRHDAHAYDGMSYEMQKLIKLLAPEQIAPKIKLLKERKFRLNVLHQKIQKIHCIIGALDALQDEDHILAKHLPADINQRVLLMQDHIEKIVLNDKLPLSVKNDIDEIYPILLQVNAQPVSVLFCEKSMEDQQFMLKTIVDISIDIFEKNGFISYEDYKKYKADHAKELENFAQTAYEKFITSHDDLLICMSFQENVIEQLLTFALSKNHERFVAESLKFKK